MRAQSFRFFLQSIRSIKVNLVVKILIASDFFIWSAMYLLSPIMALFVTERIIGADIAVVGIATSVYFVSKSIFEIPVGLLIDRTISEKDNFFMAIFGALILSAIYFLFPLISTIWQLYFIQGLAGFGAACAYPGWYTLFGRHIDFQREALEWSLHDIVIGVGMTIASVSGAFLAQRFGFDVLFLLIGIFSSIGAFTLLIIRKKIII